MVSSLNRQRKYSVERSTPQQGSCFHTERTRITLSSRSAASGRYLSGASGEEDDVQPPPISDPTSTIHGDDGSSGFVFDFLSV